MSANYPLAASVDGCGAQAVARWRGRISQPGGMAGGDSSDDDDMPSLLDQTSDGDSDGGGGAKKPKSKSKSKTKSKLKIKSKTPGAPVQVEEPAEVKAQKLLETEAATALAGILAEAARTEDIEVAKKGIETAKALECASPAHRATAAHVPRPT